MLAMTTQHFPRYGRRRPFDDEGQALAYEAGWDAYHAELAPPSQGPARTGYFDALENEEQAFWHAQERCEEG